CRQVVCAQQDWLGHPSFGFLAAHNPTQPMGGESIQRFQAIGGGAAYVVNGGDILACNSTSLLAYRLVEPLTLEIRFKLAGMDNGGCQGAEGYSRIGNLIVVEFQDDGEVDHRDRLC